MYDLGSGKGIAIIYAALLFPLFKKVIGIEVCQGYYDQSVELVHMYNDYHGSDALDKGYRDSYEGRHIPVRYHMVS